MERALNRIVIITGSLPPDVCGCGEYAQEIAAGMRKVSEHVEVFYKRDWALRRLFQYIRELRQLQPCAVNLQYPTQGYHWSLVPHLLVTFLRGPAKIVTLHEFSRQRREARIAMFLFFLFADWLVFTTEAERDIVCGIAPWVRSKSSVIPIGSNIPFESPLPETTDIAYFGLIHPSKGLDVFESTLERCDDREQWRVKVIGQIVPGYERFAEEALPRLRALGIEVVLNRGKEEVAAMLSQTRVAFLPFPDGISKRRGTALAAMGNGALVVTTPARKEKELFERICVMPDSEADLPRLLSEVMANLDRFSEVRRAGREFAESQSWRGITEAYMSLIRDLTDHKNQSSRLVAK